MISPLEIQKGSILCHEGKAKRVLAIGDYIQFEGKKEWIGGSMIEGEPLSEWWLEQFGFEYRPDTVPKRWNKKMISLHSTWYLYEGLDGDICFSPHEWNYTLKLKYVHQLQLLCFSLTGEHLKVPKLK